MIFVALQHTIFQVPVREVTDPQIMFYRIIFPAGKPAGLPVWAPIPTVQCPKAGLMSSGIMQYATNQHIETTTASVCSYKSSG